MVCTSCQIKGKMCTFDQKLLHQNFHSGLFTLGFALGVDIKLHFPKVQASCYTDYRLATLRSPKDWTLPLTFDMIICKFALALIDGFSSLQNGNKNREKVVNR